MTLTTTSSSAHLCPWRNRQAKQADHGPLTPPATLRSCWRCTNGLLLTCDGGIALRKAGDASRLQADPVEQTKTCLRPVDAAGHVNVPWLRSFHLSARTFQKQFFAGRQSDPVEKILASLARQPDTVEQVLACFTFLVNGP